VLYLECPLAYLVVRLRRTVFYEGHGERTDAAEEAADRIEALKARVAELTEAERINGEACDSAQTGLQKAREREKALKARVARLRGALRESRIMVASWGAYANDYFKDKHDLAGDLAEIDAALAEANDAG